MAQSPPSAPDLNPTHLLRNLAREACLLDHGMAETFWIWRSPPALVLGKNQNPWLECNLAELQARNLPLFRRISGGGAVYHDPGNLNLSWILPRAGYRPETLQHWLRDQLEDIGVPAEASPSGGLRVGRGKISGAAFCYRKDLVLHHCTLLVDADLPALRASLSPPRLSLQTHAVRSVPAAVRNLKEFQPSWDIQDWTEALTRRARNIWPSPPSLPEQPWEARMREMVQPEWIWGLTPRFRVDLGSEIAPLTLDIRRGCLMSAENSTGLRKASTPLPLWTNLDAALAEELGLNPARFWQAWEAQGLQRIDNIPLPTYMECN